jgi:hypothetical protein
MDKPIMAQKKKPSKAVAFFDEDEEESESQSKSSFLPPQT